MKKIILIFIVFFFYYYSCFAVRTDKSNNTVFNVKVIDKDLKIGEDPIIKILISAYPLGGVEFRKSIDFAYEQVALKEGNIFNVFSPADVFYMYIYYEGSRMPTGVCYQVDNIYIIKAGSEFTIELDNQSIEFFGEGALIPNLQTKIIKTGYISLASDLALINGKEYIRYFQKIDRSRDSILQVQLKIIEDNKAILGEDYVKVLTANCYGYRYYAQLRGYDFLMRQNDLFFKIFKKYYYEKMNGRVLPSFSNEILDASPIFANYIMEELNIQERIGHQEYGPMLTDSSIRNIVHKINTNFKGTLKDKLLTIFALRTNKNENASPFFEGILKTVKTKRYHDLLVSKIKVKESNIPFKDFILEDETGKRYTLDSFKNKVVVLDFWFTGCENCTILNEAMKPIVQYFSSNDQIHFVNISIDRNKKQWLNSVKTGNYTHNEGVNLYTNGEGSNHDLIRYYNITSYPTVFVIKDGIMFSSLPPRPSRKIPPGQTLSVNGIRLIELLEKALKL